MNNYKAHQHGFSLVELMIAAVIGLLLSYAAIQIYVTQTQIYRVTNSQSLIQSTENAIANLVTPIIRSAGFMGCGSLSTSISNLNGGGSPPIASLNTNSTLLTGYNRNGATITISQGNPANDTNSGNWTPSLDSSLAGNVQNTSDVLVVLGATPGSFPVSITTIDSGSDSFTVQSMSGINLAAGRFAGISDCIKSTVFLVTNITGTTISHGSGTGQYENSSSTFSSNYQAGAQFIPLQQTAFFVGQGQGGQSALMRGILTSTGWTIQPLVPGVSVMKVQYGIGGNGSISQYVSANAVPNWAQVYAIRLGFLIEGKVASGNLNTTQYNVLETSVTVPNDNRLRHVYEINIALRNASS
ncbi:MULTISPECIES: PilW family protein [Legionella]|uniref:PilW family protein n=1 Tax=Legionella resiliens TaxID=2905958 RepID=A0ABS8X7T5_9GAMM|nr:MULTISPECIES: PilW family protein [unclassified Legionella]MCE0724627.1 PilW family protein [Legionella sp. 9fVS26]MCE3533781.1 PilW family protein [Legionella sp. 8cVS16]QLZ69979.1 pilus assembly protein PilW [Legionella sp. PC1000]